jgi:hypothetical protein
MIAMTITTHDEYDEETSSSSWQRAMEMLEDKMLELEYVDFDTSPITGNDLSMSDDPDGGGQGLIDRINDVGSELDDLNTQASRIKDTIEGLIVDMRGHIAAIEEAGGTAELKLKMPNTSSGDAGYLMLSLLTAALQAGNLSPREARQITAIIEANWDKDERDLELEMAAPRRGPAMSGTDDDEADEDDDDEAPEPNGKDPS